MSLTQIYALYKGKASLRWPASKYSYYTAFVFIDVFVLCNLLLLCFNTFSFAFRCIECAKLLDCHCVKCKLHMQRLAARAAVCVCACVCKCGTCHVTSCRLALSRNLQFKMAIQTQGGATRQRKSSDNQQQVEEN